MPTIFQIHAVPQKVPGFQQPNTSRILLNGRTDPPPPQFPAVTPIYGQTFNPSQVPNRTRLINPRFGITITIGQAVETDSAQALTLTTTEHPSIQPTRPYVPYTVTALPNISRTNHVVALPPISFTIGLATETDTAQALTVSTQEHPSVKPIRPYVPFTTDSLPNKSRLLVRTGITVTIGLATETDTAQSITVTQGPWPYAPKRITGFTGDPLPNKSRNFTLAITTSLTVNINQAVETDSAAALTITTQEHPSITPIYGKTFNPIQVPNSSRLIFRSGNTVTLGQAVETDTAQALTAILTGHPAQGSLKPYTPFTTDLLPNKSRLYARYGISVTIGQAVETDSAVAITSSIYLPNRIIVARGFSIDPLPNKSRLYSRYGISVSFNQVTETDTAQPLTVTLTDHPAKVTYAKAFSYNQIPNKSRIYSRPEQAVTIGQAIENDSASSVSSTGQFNPIKPIVTKAFNPIQVPNISRLVYRLALSVNIGQVTETDTAAPITVTLTQHPSVQPLRGYTPFSATPLPNKSRLYARAGITVTLGVASETDQAQPISVVTYLPDRVRVARGFSTPQLPNQSRLYARRGFATAMGQVTETDTAQPLKANQSRTIGGVIEIDSAGTVTSTTQDRPCIINKGRKLFERPEPPNRSRIIFFPPSTTVYPAPIEPLPIIAGVKPTRIQTRVGRETTSGELTKERIGTDVGDEITDARLHPNRNEDEH
jgi:hypothetical protein